MKYQSWEILTIILGNFNRHTGVLPLSKITLQVFSFKTGSLFLLMFYLHFSKFMLFLYTKNRTSQLLSEFSLFNAVLKCLLCLCSQNFKSHLFFVLFEMILKTEVAISNSGVERVKYNRAYTQLTCGAEAIFTCSNWLCASRCCSNKLGDPDYLFDIRNILDGAVITLGWVLIIAYIVTFRKPRFKSCSSSTHIQSNRKLIFLIFAATRLGMSNHPCVFLT